MTTGQKLKVFISHIHEEAEVGAVLKKWIEDAFTSQVAAFVSSDPHDLPGGKDWLREIAGKLRDPDTRLLLSVLSPASILRPWISLEFGGAWIRDTPIFPLCHSGLTNDALPRPLGDFQGAHFSQPDVCDRILYSISHVTGFSYPTRFNLAEMRTELETAIRESQTATLTPTPNSESASEKAPIPKEWIRILRLLAQMKDRPGEEYVALERLAVAAGLKRVICEMHLEGMQKAGLVKVIPNWMYGPQYAISNEGVRILVELGFLKS